MVIIYSKRLLYDNFLEKKEVELRYDSAGCFVSSN